MTRFTISDFKAWVESKRKGSSEGRELRRQLKLLEELKANPHPTQKDIERVMKEILCGGSISFCCSTEKDCFYRDCVLDALGLSHKDYGRVKAKMSDLFFRYVRGGGSR